MSEQPQPPQQEAAASTSTQEALAQPESTGLGSTGQDQGGQNEDSANPDIAAVRAQVEREHALADVQKRLKELEGELERLKSEKKEVEDEKNGAVQATNQLRTQLSTLQSSQHQTTSELSVLQTRIEIIEREKKELFEEAERLQERASRGSQELYTLRAQKSEAAQKIAHLDVEVSEQRMAAESAKFNESRSKQALEAARTENLRLGKTYTDLEERFGKYRAEKQSELSTLQTDHDVLLSRLTTAESSYQALQRSYNEQATRLASAFADISNLTTSAATRKATSQSETYRLADENRLLERRANEARSTIAEREAELERVVGTHELDKKDWESKWKSEERRRREAEKRAEELRSVVDRIALASGAGTDLSPAAALAGEMRGSGKSYTQFFTEFTVQEGRLRNAENEIERLTELLDEIGSDIAEKKPLLDEQASEHGAAIDRANALAAELSTVQTTRDGLQELVKSLKAAASHHSEEVSSLQNTSDDLSRQVQNLIRQLAIRDDPSLANVNINGTTTPESGDIITDHLLEFRSLRGLQENNQKLLKLTRALMSRLDQREIRRATADNDDVDTGATLDQATETIEKLHKQLLEANKKINESTRERDFFSKLLARGEGLKWAAGGRGGNGPMDDGPGPHQETIEMLRSEIEGVRVKAEEEVRGVKVELREKEAALGEAEIAKARAEAKASMLEEQSRSLSEANNLQKHRGEGLESQVRQIQSSIAAAQNEARMALEQVALRHAEADRLRMDVAVLRAEKEQWASTEARLQSDFRSVQTERAKLQQLIENYTNVSAESERSRSEERGKLEKRIDELTRETTALRSQIDSTRAATTAAERKVSEADAALSNAVSAVRKEKEISDNLASTRLSEINELQAELARTKEDVANKNRIGLNYKTRMEAARAETNAAVTSHQTAIEAKDKEISEAKTKLGEVNKELDGVKRKLAGVEKRLEESKKADEGKELTIKRLQGELTALKASGNAGDKPALESLQKEKDTLQARISQLEKDVEEAKAASTGGDPELKTKYDEVVKKLEGADERYEENVAKVNRINTSMKSRIGELLAERATLLSKMTELEQQIKDLQSSTAIFPPTGDTTPADQATIDEAVKVAVAAKEAELAAAIAEAKSNPSAEPSSSEPSTEAIDAAVKAKEAELTSTIDTQINEALAKQKSELEAEAVKLKSEAAELLTKVKGLERQSKTAEMTRKTLERQKDVAEAKVKKLEGGGEGLSPAATAFTPSSSAIPTNSAGLAPVPTGPSGSAAPASPAGGSASIRGTAGRGRGRGTAPRGGAPRSSILQNVNATLAAAIPSAAPSPPPATTAQKRSAPEEGEITSEGQTGADAGVKIGDGEDVLAKLQSGGARGRIKRPRGNGTPRGGATTRATSGAAAEEEEGRAESGAESAGDAASPAAESGDAETKADEGTTE